MPERGVPVAAGAALPQPASAQDRLASQLESLGVLPDSRHLMAAKALVTQTGGLDLSALQALTRSLAALARPTGAEARTAALLLDHGLEATPEALARWQGVTGETAGERLASLASQEGPAATLLAPLTLPTDPKELKAALHRLVQAFLPPEADLARERVAQAPHRLAHHVGRELESHPQDPQWQRLDDELRLAQQPAASDPAFTLPIWWQGGHGEIRVQEDPEGKARTAAEGPRGKRLVISMETPQLHGMRFDCLLTPGQVNCHVVAEDPAVAEFLTAHLDQLRHALEGAGFQVPALEVTGGRRPVGGVDLYG